MEQASPDAIAADVAGDGLSVSLLGGFSVAVGRRAIEPAAWRLRKASHLIKLLALAPGQRLHDDLVMDLLWPELSPEAAYNNLRATLYFGRRLLEPDAAGTFNYLRLQGGLISLAPETAHRIDVAAYEAAAAEAHASDDPDAFLAALDLYTGNLLPEDRYLEWLDDRREALRMSRLALLLGLARRWEERGDSTAAIETLRQALAADPANEEAHVWIMRLHALAGRRSQALRQYQHLRDALQRELDVEPDPASARLYEAILAGHFPERSTPDPAHPPAVPQLSARFGRTTRDSEPVAPPGNLPAQLSSFIGRERELTEVAQSLEESRLLTLTGPGGSGKTRLAIQAAGRLAGRFPDGVWFVELAALTDPALVPHAVASILDLREQPGRDTGQTLVDALRNRQLLLLLDNCEHLAAACAELAERLLAGCQRLSIVATSREVLYVPGEALLPVAPLAVPAAGALLAVEQLAQVEAVRLFVERARLAQHGFALTAENAASVAQICRGLEGLPLAIELAAARTRSMPVEQLVGRLDEALRLLSGGARAAPARQQTLRAAIDWSYQLLPDQEQALFRRLAVCAGGFTLEAAEAVCADDGLDPAEILDILFHLIDKSLIVVEEREAGVRYRLLETIRQYGLEQLEASAESADAWRRHAAVYLRLAERAESALRGPDVADWLRILEREHDNLRAALGWAIESGSALPGLRLGWALSRYWIARGHLVEGRQWLDRLLAIEEANGRPEARAKVFFAAGRLALKQGVYPSARAHFEDCLALAGEHGNREYVAGSLTQLGFIAHRGGDYAAARALHEESLLIRRELGDPWYTAVALTGLAHVAIAQSDYQTAQAFLEESVTLYRTVEDSAEIAFSFMLLGQLAYERGQAAEAHTWYEESLARSRTIGDRYTVARLLASLGQLSIDRDDAASARALLEESLTIFQDLGVYPNIAHCLEGFARLAATQNQPERALRLAGAAVSLRAIVGDHLHPSRRLRHEQALEPARQALGGEGTAAALVEGQAMTLEQAVDYALNSPPD